MPLKLLQAPWIQKAIYSSVGDRERIYLAIMNNKKCLNKKRREISMRMKKISSVLTQKK